jgi:cell division inhibitor SepF
MAKKKGFFDYFKIADDDDEYDEDDDYIFDEEEDDDYEDDYDEPPVKKAKPATKPKPVAKPSSRPTYNSTSRDTKRFSSVRNTSTATDKLVSFEGGTRKQTPKSNEVYVIKPQAFDDAQTVADFLLRGRAIVINMEGLQLESAQRIIDFIGGACYGLGGELKAISASIFIAVPDNIELSGDLREEILGGGSGSPLLGI